MTLLASGVSVVGRQVLVNRGSTKTSFYLAIGNSENVDYSYKGVLVLEYVHPNAGNVPIQMIAKPVWSMGAFISGDEDNPASRPRTFVMFWKEAGLEWQARSTATV